MKTAMAAYQAAGWAGLALGWPVIALKALNDPRYRVGWTERLGRWNNPEKNAIWIHGASVGEMRAAAPLIRTLLAHGEPILLTATSPSGRQTALELLAGAAPKSSESQASAHLLPLDLKPFIHMAMTAAKPRALAIVETEIWPALLTEANRLKIPTIMVNARISDRSYPRYKKIKRWITPLIESLNEIQAQSETDAERFLALGAPAANVNVAGNMKFDLPLPDPKDAVARTLGNAREAGIHTIVAGSTHKIDEEIILEAVGKMKKKGNKMGLVIAPRHMERLSEAASIIESAGEKPALWSQIKDPLEAFEAGKTILIDSYGILGKLYGGAECAVVGGTFAPVGGHNLLEPLNWGVPVIFGPNTQNARDIRDQIISLNLGVEAKNSNELEAVMYSLLDNQDSARSFKFRAETFFKQNRGAVNKAMDALEACGAISPQEGCKTS